MEKDYNKFIDLLCNGYGDALYQYAARQVHDLELAKDLVQEVFLLLTIRAAYVYTHQNPQGWMFKVMGNLILREQKKPYHSDVPLMSDEISLLSGTDEHFFQILPGGLSDEECELLTLRIEKNGTTRRLRSIKESRLTPAAKECRERCASAGS